MEGAREGGKRRRAEDNAVEREGLREYFRSEGGGLRRMGRGRAGG